MSHIELKYKLKGHETFAVREGWLNKGITVIRDNDKIFSSNDAMDVLGVGSKMVKSIRYWLLASNLVREHRAAGQKHALRLTPELGEIIWKYDRYFEDIFTLWIIHYHLVSNQELCTIWNLFFNAFHAREFSKTNMINLLTDEFNKIYDKGSSVSASISDDCNCILKMYCATDHTGKEDPEDNLTSPFAELGLIKKDDYERGSYQRTHPIHAKLDRLVVLYIIISNLNAEKPSVDIDTLLFESNNVGNVLNLDRNMLNGYLDILRQEGYLILNRTAGLDMVYLKKEMTQEDVLREYYTQIERDA